MLSKEQKEAIAKYVVSMVDPGHDAKEPELSLNTNISNMVNVTNRIASWLSVSNHPDATIYAITEELKFEHQKEVNSPYPVQQQRYLDKIVNVMSIYGEENLMDICMVCSELAALWWWQMYKGLTVQEILCDKDILWHWTWER